MVRTSLRFAFFRVRRVRWAGLTTSPSPAVHAWSFAMSIVPSSKPDRIAFYEDHIAVWTASATDLGILPSECTALAALVASARSAYSNQGIAADAARSATSDATLAVQSMHTLGASVIAKIKAYAESTGNPGVLNTAQLPQPNPDSPVGPPGKPTDFVVTLNQSGSLNLKWKCANPPGAVGTVYEVLRRIGAGGTFTYVGVAGGDKSYTDETLPAGSSGVAYRVTGLRSGLRGPTVQCDVNFGVAGGGGFTVQSVVESEAPEIKVAA